MWSQNKCLSCCLEGDSTQKHPDIQKELRQKLVVVLSGRAPTPLGTSIIVHHVKNLHTHEVKHNGGMGMGHLRLFGDGVVGHLWLKWVRQLWQSKLLFLGGICSKMLVIRGVPFPVIT